VSWERPEFIAIALSNRGAPARSGEAGEATHGAKRALQLVDVDRVHTVKGEAHRLGDLLQFDERGARCRARGHLARSLGRPAGSPPAAAPEHFKRPGNSATLIWQTTCTPRDCKAMTEGGRMSSLPTQPTDQAQYAESAQESRAPALRLRRRRTPPGFMFNAKAYGLLTGHYLDVARSLTR
jgi:hypothetical protein